MTVVNTLDIGPQPQNIKVTQKNTVPWQMIDLETAATARDVTGNAYLLTVYSEDWIGDDEPVATPLFQQSAAIFDAPNGIVVFTPGATDHDLPPGKYFYAIRKTVATGPLWTIAKGTYEILPRLTP